MAVAQLADAQPDYKNLLKQIEVVEEKSNEHYTGVIDARKEIHIPDSNLDIKGVLMDSTLNEPVPFSMVVIKGTDIGVATDYDGRFRLEIPKDSISYDSLILEVRSIGYGNSYEKIAIHDLPLKNLVINLEYEAMFLLGGCHYE